MKYIYAKNVGDAYARKPKTSQEPCYKTKR